MPVNLRNRSPNAGTMPIKPPAQRRMGVKRRLVDQGLWFNAGVHPGACAVLLAAGHLTPPVRHRYREIRPVMDLDARLAMHGAIFD